VEARTFQRTVGWPGGLIQWPTEVGWFRAIAGTLSFAGEAPDILLGLGRNLSRLGVRTCPAGIVRPTFLRTDAEVMPRGGIKARNREGADMASERMCARSGCGRLGQKTTERRCQSCGYTTVEWSEAAAQRIRNLGTSADSGPSFRVGMPVATANELPGWEITAYVGEVFGLVVRSPGAVPQIGASLKSVLGGELRTMTNLLRSTREQAVQRLAEEAEGRGADAVIAMRFDITTMGDPAGWTEVCAYGTAVSARPVTPDPA
jgi:uncharacterized protein YbjQ (UPF0145 family)